MARDLAGMLNRWIVPLSPVGVGLILANNTAIIPFLPVMAHTIIGWGMAIGGAINYFAMK